MSINRLVVSLCALIVCALVVSRPSSWITKYQVRSEPNHSILGTSYSVLGAGDWPTYAHDNQRTGYNPDETIIGPDNVALLTQAWQAPIGINSQGGTAYSAPSVGMGKVFIASSLDEGANFFARDAATGNLSWSAFIGYNPGECFGVGIGSTPAISGTVVCCGW